MKRQVALSILVPLLALGFWLAAGSLAPRTASAQTRPILPLPSLLQIQPSGITTLTATAGDARGEIDLRWIYGGKAFRGTFLVERSTNRTTWAPVTGCSLSYSMRTTSYTCTDSKLISRRAYYYRACIPATGSKTCTTANAAVPRRTPVIAP
jgi:hypothetical protein